VVTGVTADLLGVPAALWLVAALTCFSGLLAAWRMTETGHIMPSFDALKG